MARKLGQSPEAWAKAARARQRYFKGQARKQRRMGARRGCQCPPGSVAKSTKGRGTGVACMRRVNNAPRFAKKGTPGARPVKTKRGTRWMTKGPGWRFVAPHCPT